MSPALQVDFFTSWATREAQKGSLHVNKREKLGNKQPRQGNHVIEELLYVNILLLRLRGQTSLSSLNCLRACTLKKYQPSLKRPANNWMVQGENQRGTHCPVDPYFGRNSAGEIPSPSFSFPPFMAGWWPGPKLHFTLVPKALSQGLLHWLAQWLDMQHPETDKDIPGSAHCFALVPLLCSGTARTSLKKDKKDRRVVCLTSQDISVLFCYPHPLYIHSLFQGTGLWQADCCAGTLCPTSFIHSVTEPQNKRKMLVKLGQMRTLSPNFPQISMCG